MKPYVTARRFILEQDDTGTYIQFGFGSDDDDDSGLADPSQVAIQMHGKNYVTSKAIDPTKLLGTDKLGISPQSVKEKRENEKKQRAVKKYERHQEARDNLTFNQFVKKYIEWARVNKKSWRDDKQRYESHLKSTLGQAPIKQITGEKKTTL